MSPPTPDTKETQEGHIGHLTPSQTHRLQEVWIHLLRLCDIPITTSNPNLPADRTSEFREKFLALHPHHHHHHHHHHDHPNAAGNTAAPKPITPSIFRSLIWDLFLADHPDVMVLRYLRARKFDVSAGLGMLLSALYWRHEQDLSTIVRLGESVALSPTPTDDDKNFIKQYESGKAFVHGKDKEGRPVFVIKVRLHNPKLQTGECMERFVLHNIETIRSLVRIPSAPGGEKACLVFDLTGFGLKNMDFHVVKFLVGVFEARYPEYLGVVLVHNAPWVFWGIWRVIKPWLDPVIASKINFTNNKDMLQHIPAENLQKCYGGKDTWEYKYIHPVEGENESMDMSVSANLQTRDKLQAQREELVARFESATVEWAVAGLNEEATAKVKVSGVVEDHVGGMNGNANGHTKGIEAAAEQLDEGRFLLARKLQENFWQLDPYVKARCISHRNGMIGEGGKITEEYKAVR